MKPAVAVVIPCFNDEHYVAEAIECVRRQTLEEWECVVVDDGSDDHSADAIKAAIGRDSRFTLIQHPSNLGLPAARNTGLANSEANWVAFLDSDDLLTNRSLELRAKAIRESDQFNVAGSYSGVRFEDESVSLSDLPSLYRSGPSTIVDFLSAGGECPFPVHGPLVRRQVIEEVGAFDNRLTHGTEDWDLWYRILRIGLVFVPTMNTTAVYRQRKASMTRTQAEAHVAAAQRLVLAAQKPDTSVNAGGGGARPLTKALGDYVAQVQIAQRALRFAAMMALDGETQSALQIIEALDISDPALVLRHVDVDQAVRGAVLRVSGRDHEHPPSESTELTKTLRDALASKSPDHSINETE